MRYETKFVQDLCTTDTQIYEEVLQFALNEKAFFQDVRNLRKSSLEALVYVLLMKLRGKLPNAMLGKQIDLADFIAVIHENNLRLQSDGETFGWVLSVFALMVVGEEDVESIRPQLATLVQEFESNFNELPVYYDLLRTLLILAKERPQLAAIFSPLDGEKMVGRLTSESSVMKMKALACLQTMTEFNPQLFDVWLRALQNPKLIIETKSFMLHQLIETLLRLDDKKAEIIQTLQCDHVWRIILESLTSKLAICRKEALAIIQYAIGYAKQCGHVLSGTYFNWPLDEGQAEKLSYVWQAFVTVAEALNETQTHLILPALELVKKMAHLDDVWKNLLLRLILLHENPRVVNYGIQHFLQQRYFDSTEPLLENQFLDTFNRTTLFDNVSEIIRHLQWHYCKPQAVEYLLKAIPDICWNSVPYYCIVKVIHDAENQLNGDSSGCVQRLKFLTNSVKVCHDIKNVSLRYVTVLLLLKTITRYVSRCRTFFSSEHLLTIVSEIEKLSPMFLMSLERFQDDAGWTFCDAISQEALLTHLPKVSVTDTFFIKEMLLKRITQANRVEQEALLKTLSQANLVVFLNVLQQLPEELQSSYLKLFPQIATSDRNELKQAIESRKTIPSSLFSVLQEIAKFEATDKRFDGWQEIFTDLKRLTNDRLTVFDYTQNAAVETIQTVHLLALHAEEFSLAHKFFQMVSLRELKDGFRRHQSTTPSIDEVYGMISEIYLCHSRSQTAGGCGFNTEEDWSKLISLLDVGNINVLLNVIEILHDDSGTGESLDETRLVVVDRCYKEILNYRKSDHFMKLIEKFLTMLLRPYTKMTADQDLDNVEVHPKVTEYVKMFLDQASTIYGLANIVFEAVFRIPIPIMLNWSALGKLLLQGMVFGDVQKREQRIENEVIDQCGVEISFKHHPRYLTQADARVRVLCVLFLSRIVKANHPDAVLFLLKLERMLIERFNQITKAKERYYADSITHRQKLRIVQALCVVLKLTGTKPYPLLDVMLYETNQPNINYLIELIVADSTIDTLTVANSLQNEKVKVSGIQSVFVILWLRCCQTNLLDERYIYLLLPWTMAQNFSTRLYAQITITKLIAKFSPQPVEDGPFREIYGAVNSYLRQGNVERNIEKCMKDFRFNSVFDYENLLTMENIFHNIPKVSVAPPEDIVGTSILRECLQTLALGEGNLGQALHFDQLVSEKRENMFLAQSFGGADFVQRKIVPLKSLEPNQELLLGLPENLCAKKMDFKEGLIVVASLVNRAPNLGGLARTSEIFAVKQFVINSLQDIDNKEFQALSMTAEKWLTVGELKAHKIVEYLEEMKGKGYAIVGAEQTTGSKPIQELQFPKKCVLVLGHEKNGLPAEIIRHLDLIGEIPQFGVVRSLNVHVTGAIFMWEYAKQHHVAKPIV